MWKDGQVVYGTSQGQHDNSLPKVKSTPGAFDFFKFALVFDQISNANNQFSQSCAI